MPSRPVNPPIVASSTFRFADTAALERSLRGELPMYSRWDNPTVQAVEARLAEVIGAERALAFGSGMAAISSALLCALAERPRLLCQAQVYGGTFELATELLPAWGVAVETFDTDGWAEVLARAAADEGPPVGAVFCETPTNPALRVVDLGGLAAAARALGALLIVDNTFATPVNQRPLALGADVVVHSASKGLGGHHDLLAGVVAGSAGFVGRLWRYRKLLGGVLDPFPAYLLHRGLQTLEVRVARQNATALALATWLEARPGVGRVHYPGLASCPQRELAARQMTAGGSVLAFEVAGGEAAARALVDALEVIGLAASLGGAESLACMPSNTSHVGLSPEERERSGLPASLVRLSVGLEPVDALTDDLARGLAAAAGPSGER